jgi:4,5-DOPA dioxygenase extradiol
MKTTTDKMPVLFVGHGNPMNAITDNLYSQTWQALGKKLTTPKAILCISAHWLTQGTAVTMAEHPKTIHDFGGFPDALFKVQYPAPGAADYAHTLIATVKSATVKEDYTWGLDHGSWSILKNMYPNADVPVFQLSLDRTKSPIEHFHLATELYALRTQGY